MSSLLKSKKTPFNKVVDSPKLSLHVKLALITICLGLFTGCSLRSPSRPPKPDLPIYDDRNFEGFLEGVGSTQRYLRASGEKVMRFGARSISRRDYAEALEKLVSYFSIHSKPEDRIEYIRQNFIFLNAAGESGKEPILLTGYFEPLIKGSQFRTNRFSQPLYSLPPDLLTISLKDFSQKFVDEGDLKARVVGNRIVPYYTRAEIDGKHQALSDKGLELAWVDPVDAFFLQIQGSGTVQLHDGTDRILNFADKNGRRYEAIGKYIKEAIHPETVSMQSIASYLRRLPHHERNELLFKNESYVFFRPSTERAVTASGAPATAARTIATDPKVYPKGALAYVTFNDPVAGFATSRFVLDQDTGGAIKGPGRVDLFCGRGEEASLLAGQLQDKGAEISYLFPIPRP